MSKPSKTAMSAADDIAHKRHLLHEESLRDAIIIIGPLVDAALAPEREAADEMASLLVYFDHVGGLGLERHKRIKEVVAAYEKARGEGAGNG